jgi:para-nitrobenzyl esterase
MTPYFGPGWVRGEEYLTVDVRTPAADTGRRSVMVFVHGGGFVTVNYRLGVPGFLDLEGAPANRGLLDVLAALSWVRNTIAAFGGDPDHVTIFGQSAGATLVGALLATPEATGLFRRAIMQSGSGTGAFTPEQAQRVTATAAATRTRRPRSPRTARHCRTRHRVSFAVRCSERPCSVPVRPAWRKPTHKSRAAAPTSTRSGIARRH